MAPGNPLSGPALTQKPREPQLSGIDSASRDLSQEYDDPPGYRNDESQAPRRHHESDGAPNRRGENALCILLDRASYVGLVQWSADLTLPTKNTTLITVDHFRIDPPLSTAEHRLREIATHQSPWGDSGAKALGSVKLKFRASLPSGGETMRPGRPSFDSSTPRRAHPGHSMPPRLFCPVFGSFWLSLGGPLERARQPAPQRGQNCTCCARN